VRIGVGSASPQEHDRSCDPDDGHDRDNDDHGHVPARRTGLAVPSGGGGHGDLAQRVVLIDGDGPLEVLHAVRGDTHLQLALIDIHAELALGVRGRGR